MEAKFGSCCLFHSTFLLSLAAQTFQPITALLLQNPEQGDLQKQLLWVPLNPCCFHLPLEVRHTHREAAGPSPLFLSPRGAEAWELYGVLGGLCLLYRDHSVTFEQRGRYEPDIPTVSHKQPRLSHTQSSPPSHFDFTAPSANLFCAPPPSLLPKCDLLPWRDIFGELRSVQCDGYRLSALVTLSSCQ